MVAPLRCLMASLSIELETIGVAIRWGGNRRGVWPCSRWRSLPTALVQARVSTLSRASNVDCEKCCVCTYLQLLELRS